MATSVINTGDTAIKLAKVKYIFGEILTKGSNGAYTKSGKVYRFDNVLRDSTTLSQNDNETNTIDNEVSDEPIYTNVTQGSFQFEATIEDVQANLLKDFCGYSVEDTKSYAPGSYQERFAEISVVMDAGIGSDGTPKYAALVIPKLQLNTKIIGESFSSSMVGFSLAGTAYSMEFTTSGGEIKSPFYMDSDFTLPTDSVGE